MRGQRQVLIAGLVVVLLAAGGAALERRAATPTPASATSVQATELPDLQIGTPGLWTPAASQEVDEGPLGPTSAGEYFNRGLSNLRRGDRDTALANFDEALRLDPDHAWAYEMRGRLRAQLGDCEGARADTYQALSIFQARNDLTSYFYVMHNGRRCDRSRSVSE